MFLSKTNNKQTKAKAETKKAQKRKKKILLTLQAMPYTGFLLINYFIHLSISFHCLPNQWSTNSSADIRVPYITWGTWLISTLSSFQTLSHSQTILLQCNWSNSVNLVPPWFPISLFWLLWNHLQGTAFHSLFHLLLRIKILTITCMVTPSVIFLHYNLNTMHLSQDFFSLKLFTLLTFLPLLLPISLGTPQGFPYWFIFVLSEKQSQCTQRVFVKMNLNTAIKTVTIMDLWT